MKPLLLGESPAPGAGPDGWLRPLSGRVCSVLCSLAGLEGSDYQSLTDAFHCLNLVTRHEDADVLPDSWWQSLQARTRFETICETTVSTCVVCLGRRVANAAGLDPVWGFWTPRRGIYGSRKLVTSIPHPSGRNRLYNANDYRELASKVLREALGMKDKF